MSVRLAFCIPTADRAGDLDRCLWSIYAEAAHHGVLDDLEICVADNCSADDTPALCARWASRFPHFRTHRQPQRLDFVSNLLASTTLASAAHLWLFGDDDSLIPGTLPLVFEALGGDPDFVHAAAITFSRLSGYAGFVGLAGGGERPVAPLKVSDLHQSDCGYITCLLFRRERWLHSPGLASRHPREITAQIQVVYECLAEGRCLAIRTPCTLIDRTPSRTAAWDGHWTVVHGYEFLKARQHRFPMKPADGSIRYHRRAFVQCFGVLSLLREHYEGLYEKAASFRPPLALDAWTLRFFRIAFASSAVRGFLISLLRRCSGKFRSRLAVLSELAKQPL
ncbi:MAG: glycosyltransferase [Chthoniobacteraceae bacterium]